MKEAKKRNTFREGPVSPVFIAESIAKHSTKTDIGAHSIFLGQVRNDLIGNRQVRAIEYTAYTEMAEEAFHVIREEAFAKYQLTCMHIYHSLGRVEAGEICLFVFTSSRHRRDAIDACNEVVERIKKEVPVWGKELFDGEDYEWKVNH
jgi:molybdopterin synthase catalytic subunit